MENLKNKHFNSLKTKEDEQCSNKRGKFPFSLKNQNSNSTANPSDAVVNQIDEQNSDEQRKVKAEQVVQFVERQGLYQSVLCDVLLEAAEMIESVFATTGFQFHPCKIWRHFACGCL